jgi:hypothetical protein
MRHVFFERLIFRLYSGEWRRGGRLIMSVVGGAVGGAGYLCLSEGLVTAISGMSLPKFLSTQVYPLLIFNFIF